MRGVSGEGDMKIAYDHLGRRYAVIRFYSWIDSVLPACLFLLIFASLLIGGFHLSHASRMQADLASLRDSYQRARGEVALLQQNRQYTVAIWSYEDFRTLCYAMSRTNTLDPKDDECKTMLRESIPVTWLKDWELDANKARAAFEYVQRAIPVRCEQLRTLTNQLPQLCSYYKRAR
jgi:hypothetical protein